MHGIQGAFSVLQIGSPAGEVKEKIQVVEEELQAVHRHLEEQQGTSAASPGRPPG